MLNRMENRWCTVVAGACANAFGAGTIMVYACPIIAGGMIAEYGWSRAETTGFFTFFLLGSGFGIATLGFWISRFGVRIPTAMLAAMFGLALASIGMLFPDVGLRDSFAGDLWASIRYPPEPFTPRLCLQPASAALRPLARN